MPADSADTADGFELGGIGLDPAAEAVYELLVDRPPSTVADLTAAWGRPDDLGRVLETLEARGLVTRAPGTPIRFAAVAPDVALEALLLTAEKNLQQARELAAELAERHRRQLLDPGHNVVELVVGRVALRQRVAQVQRRLARRP